LEDVVAYFNVTCEYLPKRTEENHKQPWITSDSNRGSD